jgi:manganese/zinc/iron transport system substrate-binding protein
MKNQRFPSRVLLLIFLLFLGGCQSFAPSTRTKPMIVASTGILGDLLQEVVGDQVEVVCLMGPGVDPHSYKASHRDVASLLEADAIFYQGLHLEGKLQNHLKKQKAIKPVIALAEALDSSLLISIGFGAFDPHIWMDVQLWKEMIPLAVKELSMLYPSLASQFEKNGHAYALSLDALDQQIRSALLKVPLEKRILVTAHDAFSYFGRAYQWEVNALQGLSTVNEFGLRDVQSLVQYTLQNELPALFIEQSVSDKSIRAILEGVRAKGGKVKLGGSLYSDALGPKNSEAGTYIGMMRTNTKTIIQAMTP